MFRLVSRLRACKHSNTSLGLGDALVTCFDCGSTKRKGEDFWLAPWLWRRT